MSYIREKRQQLLMSAGALLVSMSAYAHDNFNEAYQSFDIDAIKAVSYTHLTLPTIYSV